MPPATVGSCADEAAAVDGGDHRALDVDRGRPRATVPSWIVDDRSSASGRTRCPGWARVGQASQTSPLPSTSPSAWRVVGVERAVVDRVGDGVAVEVVAQRGRVAGVADAVAVVVGLGAVVDRADRVEHRRAVVGGVDDAVAVDVGRRSGPAVLAGPAIGMQVGSSAGRAAEDGRVGAGAGRPRPRAARRSGRRTRASRTRGARRRRRRSRRRSGRARSTTSVSPYSSSPPRSTSATSSVVASITARWSWPGVGARRSRCRRSCRRRASRSASSVPVAIAALMVAIFQRSSSVKYVAVGGRVELGDARHLARHVGRAGVGPVGAERDGAAEPVEDLAPARCCRRARCSSAATRPAWRRRAPC